jgi:hypothetical protein
MNHSLGLGDLWGSVGTQHLELDALRGEESAGGGVIKLASIIALDTPNGVAKLCGHESPLMSPRGG